jgi:3-hydroxyisobutyrate dehydrogenase
MQIAYIGMGIMGSAMAINLARAGHNVNVWNRTPGRPTTVQAVEAGCTKYDIIKDAVVGCAIIFTCVSDVDDLQNVLFSAGGVCESAAASTIIIDTATIGPDAAIEFSEKLAASGIRFLDAPVTGGDVGARNGTLTIMVGGNRDDFEEALPVLNAVGKNVQYCGPVGSGQALKLCNQILCAVNMVAVTEALLLAKRFGLDENMVPNVLGTGAGGSWALQNLGPRIIKDDFAPGFRIKDMLKDLRLVQENSSGENDLSLPGTDGARKLFEAAATKVGSDRGTQAMIQGFTTGSP